MLESYVEKCNKLLVKYPVYGRYPWEFKMSINNLEKICHLPLISI